MLVDVAMQAIANLSVNTRVAKAVADEGGITILTNLAQSMNRLVAEEAAGGLWNLSVGEDHKVVVLQMLTQDFLTIACGTFGNNSFNIFFSDSYCSFWWYKGLGRSNIPLPCWNRWSSCMDSPESEYLKLLIQFTDSLLLFIFNRNVLLVHLQIWLLMTSVAWKSQRLVVSMLWLHLLGRVNLRVS
jgi:hypothetical protein